MYTALKLEERPVDAKEASVDPVRAAVVVVEVELLVLRDVAGRLKPDERAVRVHLALQVALGGACRRKVDESAPRGPLGVLGIDVCDAFARQPRVRREELED
eukprot:4024855-Prymnesium_polylepis.1